jgi:hypothetical protein
MAKKGQAFKPELLDSILACGSRAAARANKGGRKQEFLHLMNTDQNIKNKDDRDDLE